MLKCMHAVKAAGVMFGNVCLLSSNDKIRYTVDDAVGRLHVAAVSETGSVMRLPDVDR